jgi:hypothetical protein
MSKMTVTDPKVELFLEHAKTIAEYVTSKHSKRVLMWDDEFRQLEEAMIVKSGLGSIVDIVVWNYNEGQKSEFNFGCF